MKGHQHGQGRAGKCCDEHQRCELLNPNKLGAAYVYVTLAWPIPYHYILHMSVSWLSKNPFTRGAVERVVIFSQHPPNCECETSTQAPRRRESVDRARTANNLIDDHARNQPPLAGREGGSIAEPCEYAPNGLCYLVHHADAKITRKADYGKECLHK